MKTIKYKLYIGTEFKRTIESIDIESYIDSKYGREWSYNIDKENRIVTITSKDNFMIKG